MTSTVPRASGKRGSQSRLPSRWVALALLASAQLMPDIGAVLHLQRGELPWVMTIYTVFFGGLMLLAGRSLQGLGAALMSPAALAAVMTLFTCASRGKALGVWSALA